MEYGTHFNNRGSRIYTYMRNIDQTAMLHNMRQFTDLSLISRRSPNVLFEWTFFVDFKKKDEQRCRNIMTESLGDRNTKFYPEVLIVKPKSRIIQIKLLFYPSPILVLKFVCSANNHAVGSYGHIR